VSTVELHHTIDVPDDAPVLVLGSSLGTTGGMWDDQIAGFSQRFRVLRYDTRGHGGSPAPTGPYSIADLGGDVLALLDRLEIERASFCGLSIGGMIGMWAASEAPERFERLVLCCTLPHFPPRDLWDERAATVRAQGMEPMVDPAIGRWLTPQARAARPDAEDRLRAMLRATSPEGYAGCCEAIRDMDLRDRLGSIAAPTLVIAAAEDPSTPPERVKELVADAIPGARYTEVPGAAHIANIAQPDAFSRAVLEHLSG
jgi:3-oxoadipate enol-lactonase